MDEGSLSMLLHVIYCLCLSELRMYQPFCQWKPVKMSKRWISACLHNSSQNKSTKISMTDHEDVCFTVLEKM